MTSYSYETVNSRLSRAKPLACDGRYGLDLAARLNHKEDIQFVTCGDASLVLTGMNCFLWYVQVHIERVIPSAVRDHVAITIHSISFLACMKQ